MEEQPFKILASNKDIYAYLYGFPNECPHCHKHIIPEIKSDYLDKSQYSIFVTLLCPNINCDMPFIAYYSREGNYDYRYSLIIKHTSVCEDFSQEINNVSTKFQDIFNESFFAEQNNLFEICGVGYRKALEFLIKDYLILLNPDNEELIKKSSISNCINSFVEDAKIKSTSKRAIWLGNDHTHYEKKWNDKDLNDLKTLIRLTINWIESEILTKKFNDSMN